jgi:uncharacterized coiled-coil protein SlyX
MENLNRRATDKDGMLEDRVRVLEIRQATTEQRIDTIGSDVKEIKSTLSKLNWVVILAVVVQLVNLVIMQG